VIISSATCMTVNAPKATMNPTMNPARGLQGVLDAASMPNIKDKIVFNMSQPTN